MLRALLTATALLCLSQAALPQELTAEQRDACKGDYEKYCKSVVPGGGRIIACLAKESDQRAPACKNGLETAEHKERTPRPRRPRGSAARTASATEAAGP